MINREYPHYRKPPTCWWRPSFPLVQLEGQRSQTLAMLGDVGSPWTSMGDPMLLADCTTSRWNRNGRGRSIRTKGCLKKAVPCKVSQQHQTAMNLVYGSRKGNSTSTYYRECCYISTLLHGGEMCMWSSWQDLEAFAIHWCPCENTIANHRELNCLKKQNKW